MDDVIKDFLSRKKSDRLKKNISTNMTAEQVSAIAQDADEEFLLDNWLPKAAKRAAQLSLVSHPSKFSHPSAKTSSVIAESKSSADGFLRTGNANATIDAFGRVEAMDVFKFLSLVLSDGKTLLKHLELNSEKIKTDLKVMSVPFEELRAGLLAIKKTVGIPMTSEKVKQVYFPVVNDYHLLSILTPSGLIFELRNRIRNIFSEQAKVAKEDKRKNIYNDIGFDDLYKLSMIGYGGTKPQNISVLNSTYGGKAYLLPSVPPLLTKQNQRLPKNNFFIYTLWPKNFEEDFLALHKLFKTDYNNENIRKGRDRRIQSVIDKIIEKMWLVRNSSAEKNYAQLPRHQKIWLDEASKADREIDDEWLHKVITECARWFIYAYKKIVGNKAILLGDDELAHIKNIIEQNEEGLR